MIPRLITSHTRKTEEKFTQTRIDDLIDSHNSENVINSLIISHLSLSKVNPRPYVSKSAMDSFSNSLGKAQSISMNSLQDWFLGNTVKIDRALAAYYTEYDIEVQRRGLKSVDTVKLAELWHGIIEKRVRARKSDKISEFLWKSQNTIFRDVVSSLISRNTNSMVQLITGVPIQRPVSRSLISKSNLEKWEFFVRSLLSNKNPPIQMDWSQFKIREQALDQVQRKRSIAQKRKKPIRHRRHSLDSAETHNWHSRFLPEVQVNK